jgi:DNA polymerase-3 subunit epsilon
LEVYNQRVRKAIASLRETKSDYAIRLKGRNPEENGFVLVQENLYTGYGFVPKDTPISTQDDFESYLTRQKNTLETQRIVEAFVRKSPKGIMSFTRAETY